MEYCMNYSAMVLTTKNVYIILLYKVCLSVNRNHLFINGGITQNICIKMIYLPSYSIIFSVYFSNINIITILILWEEQQEFKRIKMINTEKHYTFLEINRKK